MERETNRFQRQDAVDVDQWLSANGNASRMPPGETAFGQPVQRDGGPLPGISQAVAAGMGPLQMRRSEEGYELTEAGNYKVSEEDRTVLYVRTGAAAPRPAGLYAVEETTDHDNFRAFRPNAHFVRSDDRDAIDSAYKKSVYRDDRLGIQQTAKKVADKLLDAATMERFATTTFALLGKNDCAVFAQALEALIQSEEAEHGLTHEQINLKDREDSIPTQVGDYYRHIYQSEDASCGHHAATVVAEDGGEAITLEAHVSKDLAHPHFHVREGAAGFVRDNNTDAEGNERGLGDALEYRRDSTTGAGDEIRNKERFGRRLRGEDGPENVRGMLRGNIGLTRRNQMRTIAQLFETLRLCLNDDGWNSKGKALFGTKLPDGIGTLRSRLMGSESALVKIGRTAEFAEIKKMTTDSNRDVLVQELYNTVAELSVDRIYSGISALQSIQQRLGQ